MENLDLLEKLEHAHALAMSFSVILATLEEKMLPADKLYPLAESLECELYSLIGEIKAQS